MKPNLRSATAALALLLPVLTEIPAAWGLQTIDARDGVSVDAAISIKEPTRIKVADAAITDVFGNIHSSNCGGAPPAAAARGAPPAVNPGGEVVLECDREKGEIYVKPVGSSSKPVNLFVSTSKTTYTLVLRRVDMPADTILIRDRSLSVHAQERSGRAGVPGQHVRRIKLMLGAMAASHPGADVRVEDHRRPVGLWKEARFVLLRTYESRGLVGEKYRLTNISRDPMVLAEQEFDRDGKGVVAVSIENLNLRPGDSTVVYVIRSEGQP